MFSPRIVNKKSFKQKSGQLFLPALVATVLFTLPVPIGAKPLKENPPIPQNTGSYSHRQNPPNFVKTNKPQFVPDEIILKVKSEADGNISITNTAKNNTVTGLASLDKLHKKFGAHKMKRILKKGIKRKLPAKAQKLRQGLLRIYKVKLKKGTDVLVAASEYKKNPNIEYAEPNYIYHTNTVPNDPGFSQQWGLHNTGQTGGVFDADIDAAEAWDIDTGDTNVVIAVVDTGVDWDHPDLAANIWINTGEIENNGIDDDGNGFVDDYRGWDFVTVDPGSVPPGEDPGPEDNDPMDFHGHGTHLSGIIGAVTDNNLGMAGIAWNCSIMAVRAGYMGTDGLGRLRISDIANAITYAADNGANIVNMSFGGSGSSVEKDALDYASAAGLLLVAAAGNSDSDNDTMSFFPASYDNENIISVAATDHNDELASFSNYGATSVDVAAPGVNIYSTLYDDTYYTWSGTSMAAPHVAGLAALVWAKYGVNSSDYREVKNAIMFSVDQVPDLAGKVVTEGRINAYRALTIAGPFIYSLRSDHGPVGLNVTISGGGFGNIQGSGYVSFNGVNVTNYSFWSSSKIECTVPVGTTTGDVTVTTAEGTSNGKLFTVCPYSTYYRDADRDGFGNPNDIIQDCFTHEGYVTDNTDCDDSDPSRYPEASEICNNKDNNCNNVVDDGCIPGTTIYVPDNFNTIQGAIIAAIYRSEIIVRDGTYKENLDFLGKAVTVRSENGRDVTIIDGNHKGRVVTFESGEGEDSVLDGFTIINGMSIIGGGIHCSGSSPRITNCIIRDNMTDRYSGGGIHCAFSRPSITNCIIRDNTANQNGGGIFNHMSSPTITNCTIYNNTALTFGGGIFFAFYSSPIIVNSLIHSNLASKGGGIHVDELSSPQIINCVISNNTATKVGGGMRCWQASPYFVNTIFWNNSPELSIGINSNPKFSYSNIKGGYPGLGNINTDPLFMDAENGDYRLRNGSPCINTGHPRIYDEDTTRSDMGTYGGKGGTDPITINITVDIAGHGDYTSIQDAIDYSISGDTITVLPGTYTENIVIGGKNISLTGQDIAVPTIIDGSGSGSVVIFSNVDSSAKLQGITLRNGSAGKGGGIYCLHSAPKISNCKISDNLASHMGGGIYVENKSSPLITNCTINGNDSLIYGGGISNNWYSTPSIVNCTISSNTASRKGGGITGNNYSSATVINSILWENTAGETGNEIYLEFGKISVRYSNIEGDWSGYGNIDTDPLFVDPANGNFHLQTGSPNIDAGDPASAPPDFPADDMDGDSRPKGTRYDIGSDEALCPDNDGDGYWGEEGCGTEKDCDDTDENRFPGNPDVCDGKDNDCDGGVDEDFPDLGDSCTTGSGACLTDGNMICTDNGQGTVCEGTIKEGFESGDFSSFQWTTGGKGNWSVVAGESNSGNYSAQAPTLSWYQSSYLKITLDVPRGSISFSRKISSKSGLDWLRFFIDGVKVGFWWGERAWEEVSFPVDTAGQHTFKWKYKEDGDLSNGTDSAWIDDITFHGNNNPSEEICDGIDNDCDNATDEELGTTTCGFGECGHTVDNCVGGVPQSCDPLEGSSTEICDGLDNNCNGDTDEVCGNVDGNDCIDNLDVSCLYQWVIGNPDSCLKDVPSCNSCDVDGNGHVDIMDVLCINRRIIGNQSCLDSADVTLCIP